MVIRRSSCARGRAMRSAAGILLAALCIPALPAAAELSTSADLSLTTGVIRTGGELSLATLGEARLTFQAEASRDVRALVELDTLLAPGSFPDFTLDVPRAYLKVRFPGVRLTAGKTRLSWGSGFIFDAGDVIFGGSSPLVDLSALDPRDRTAWLFSGYLPLGDLSFLEAVLLPSLPKSPARPWYPGMPAVPAQPLVPFTSAAGGGRAVLGFPGLILEAGYLYDGADDVHLPYVGAQGSLVLDLYAAAGAAVPGGALSWDDVKKSLRVSCGAGRVFLLEAGGSIGIRCEAGFVPCGEWTAVAGGLPPASPGYGASIFAELSYAPVDTLSFQARSIVSPVDTSGIVFFSAAWGVFQGFSITGSVSAMFGEPGDTFSWGRDGDLSILIGLEHRF